MGYGRLYFLRKAYSLYPGVVRPHCAGFLEAHYRRRRRERGPLRAALDAIVGLGFRAWLAPRAWQVQRRFGLDAAWRRRAVAIARARFADPHDIALFRITEADALATYIRRFEDAALNKRINPSGWTRDCALADKRRFQRRCAAAGLPQPDLIATIDGDVLAVIADPAGRELIAKPADGEGGDGIWSLGAVADRDALARLLAARGRATTGPLLVQVRVATHPALSLLALNALPTVRVVTILDEAGAPEVVSATLRFASRPGVIVDNMKAGGLFAAVDLDKGTLGHACHGYGGGDHISHPVTGAIIAGRPLPDWPATRTLACRAHATAFADYALIGWDIAMTPQGPLLIEGNGKPGVLMPQRAARRGLGEGRYGALLAYHLALSSNGLRAVA